MPQRAIDVLEAYMRLDPFHAPWLSFLMGAACFMLEHYARALRVLQDYVSRAPRAAHGHIWLAATYAQLGRLDEARAEVAEVLRLRPGYYDFGSSRRIVAFKHAKDDKHFFDALRKSRAARVVVPKAKGAFPNALLAGWRLLCLKSTRQGAAGPAARHQNARADGALRPRTLSPQLLELLSARWLQCRSTVFRVMPSSTPLSGESMMYRSWRD